MNPEQAPPTWPSADPSRRRWSVVANPIGAFLRFVDRDGLIPLSLLLLTLLGLCAAVVGPARVHETVEKFREETFVNEAASRSGVDTAHYDVAKRFLQRASAEAATFLEQGGTLGECYEVAGKRTLIAPANMGALRHAVRQQCHPWEDCPCESDTDTRPSCQQQVQNTTTRLTQEVAACDTAARAAVEAARTASQQQITRRDQALTTARAENNAPPQPWIVLFALMLSGLIAAQVAFHRYAGLGDDEQRNASKPRRVVYVIRTLFEMQVLTLPVIAIGTLIQVKRVEALRNLVPFGDLGTGKLVLIVGSALVLLVALHVLAMIFGSLADALVHAGAVMRLAAGAEPPHAAAPIAEPSFSPDPPSFVQGFDRRSGSVAVAVLTVIVSGTGLLSLGALAWVPSKAVAMFAGASSALAHAHDSASHTASSSDDEAPGEVLHERSASEASRSAEERLAAAATLQRERAGRLAAEQGSRTAREETARIQASLTAERSAREEHDRAEAAQAEALRSAQLQVATLTASLAEAQAAAQASAPPAASVPAAEPPPTDHAHRRGHHHRRHDGD